MDRNVKIVQFCFSFSSLAVLLEQIFEVLDGISGQVR